MAIKKLKKSERYYHRDEALEAIQHAVVYQCLYDIKDSTKRAKYWDEVWKALADFAPCYHMTRGEMVIRSAHSGFVAISREEMEKRDVFESQFETDLYESGCSL